MVYIFSFPACFIVSSSAIYIVMFQGGMGGLFSLVLFLFTFSFLWGNLSRVQDNLYRTGRYKKSILIILLSNIASIALGVGGALITGLLVRRLSPISDLVLFDILKRLWAAGAVCGVGFAGYILPGYLYATKKPESVDRSHFSKILAEALRNVESNKKDVRKQAVHELGFVGKGSKEAIEAIRQRLSDKEPAVRLRAVEAIGRIRSVPILIVKDLLDYLQQSDQKEKFTVRNTLRAVTGHDYGNDLAKWNDWFSKTKESL